MPAIIRLMDVATIIFSGWIALHLRLVFPLEAPFPEDLRSYYSLIASAGIVFLALSREVYQSWRGAALPFMLARVTSTWLLVILSLLLWLFITKASEDFSRFWFGLWAGVGVIGLWLERLSAYWFLRQLRFRGLNLKHVALLGDGPSAKQIESRLKDAGWTGYHVKKRIKQPTDQDLHRLSKEKLDEIWLAIPLSETENIHRILRGLNHSSASIRFSPDWFTFRLINHGVSDLMGIPMLDLSASPLNGSSLVIKFLEDRIFSAIILILLSPLMLILAIGVKMSSKGPIFYRQERVGLNNQTFTMLKFRSMPQDTDQKNPSWGEAKGKVTTRFGRFIRKTSLDELPQFFNVLKGDMSIVGPRPERPQFVEQFKDEIPDYMRKHLVKAGITGWAQVNGWRGDTDLEARIEHDLYYIENWSIWFDLRIMALTVVRGFVNPNAY